jgi:GntR family transcriptional regulator of vanillate catabolism
MQLQSKDTLDSTVYLKIKEMIIQKQLKPGELIVQNQMAQTLGVSRTPVRKALGELEKEGLLGGTPKGWYVKEFGLKELMSVFRIRAVLEGLACRLAAEKIGAPELAYLQTMFEQAYEQIDGQGTQAYYDADVKFHSMITDCVGDELLKRTIQANEIIYTSQMQGLYREPQETFPEHLAIIDALLRRDGELASRLMQRHIELAIEVLERGEYSVYK